MTLVYLGGAWLLGLVAASLAAGTPWPLALLGPWPGRRRRPFDPSLGAPGPRSRRRPARTGRHVALRAGQPSQRTGRHRRLQRRRGGALPGPGQRRAGRTRPVGPDPAVGARGVGGRRLGEDLRRRPAAQRPPAPLPLRRPAGGGGQARDAAGAGGLQLPRLPGPTGHRLPGRLPPGEPAGVRSGQPRAGSGERRAAAPRRCPGGVAARPGGIAGPGHPAGQPLRPRPVPQRGPERHEPLPSHRYLRLQRDGRGRPGHRLAGLAAGPATGRPGRPRRHRRLHRPDRRHAVGGEGGHHGWPLPVGDTGGPTGQRPHGHCPGGGRHDRPPAAGRARRLLPAQLCGHRGARLPVARRSGSHPAGPLSAGRIAGSASAGHRRRDRGESGRHPVGHSGHPAHHRPQLPADLAGGSAGQPAGAAGLPPDAPPERPRRGGGRRLESPGRHRCLGRLAVPGLSGGGGEPPGRPAPGLSRGDQLRHGARRPPLRRHRPPGLVDAAQRGPARRCWSAPSP